MKILEKNRKLAIVFVLMVSLVAVAGFVYAENEKTYATDGTGRLNDTQFRLHLDKDAIKKGYTLESFGNAFRLGVTPKALGSKSGVVLSRIDEEITSPCWFSAN
jgi:hypothetical protein